MLFKSDEDLRRLQQQAKRLPKGVEVPAEQLRIQIDDNRELREHQRWREFAWLLFIAPVWMALLLAFVGWIARKLLASGP